MAQQLVYTSASKLLDAGRSGFGTVARSRSLSPLLVSAIERVSQFANIRGTERSRVIFVHRRIVAGNNRVNLLSRIADAGVDYTGRTNHIAHHLIVTQEEMKRLAANGITPADVLRQFQWLTRWEGAPKFYGPEEDLPLERLIRPLGRQSARAAWARLTGQPGHARILAWDAAPRNGVLIVPSGHDLLDLLTEALAEFGPQSWSRTFTTSLETTDEMSDFDWIVSSPQNFRGIESRCGTRARFDLGRPHDLPMPPEPVVTKQKIPSHAIQALSIGNAQQSDTSLEQGKGESILVTIKTPGKTVSHPATLPAPRRKTKLFIPLTVAATTALMVGVILWKIAVPERTIAQQSIETNEARNKALDIMKIFGINEKDADIIAKNSAAEAWANFIVNFINQVKKPETRKADDFPINIARPRGEIPSVDEGWINSLVEARELISKFAEADESKSCFSQKMLELTEIYHLLRKAAETGFCESFSIQDCEEFDARWTRNEFNLLLGNNPDAELAEDVYDQFNSALSEQFGIKRFPERNQIIADYLKKNIGKPVANRIFEQVLNNRSFFSPDDVLGYEKAINYWENMMMPNEDDFKLIAESNFVPKNFEQLLSIRSAESQEQADLSPTSISDLGDQNDTELITMTKETKIIVIDQKDLISGVQLAPIKQVINEKLDSEAIEIIDVIKITVDDKSPINKFRLNQIFKPQQHPNTIKYYASDTKDVQIFQDGLIKLSSQNALSILIVCEFNNVKSTTWVITDLFDKSWDKKSHIVRDDLDFYFVEKCKDKMSGLIAGSLFDYLKDTEVLSGNELVLSSEDPNIKLKIRANGIYFSIHKYDLHRVGFITNDYKRLENDIKSYQESLKAKTTGRHTEDNKIANKKNQSFDKLIDTFKIAIGGVTLLGDKRLNNYNEIHKENLDIAHGVAKELGYSYELEKFTGNENGKILDEEEIKKLDQNIRNIKFFIGDAKIDDFLRQHANFKNGIDDLRRLNFQTFDDWARNTLDKFKPVEPQKSFDEIISEIKTITAASHSGRIIYRATSKD